ncbi:MAG: hypothetical protein HQM11_08260 [SAR324 cluster bacterium]|nr:hypothetical protein [SAR324 cluster bacterium]
MRTQRILTTILIGTTAGICGWLLFQLLAYIYLDYPLPFLDLFVYQGIFTGAGLGAFIYAKDAFLNQNWSLARRKLLLGSILGLVIALIAFTCAQSLLAFYVSASVVRVIAWTLWATGIASFTGYSRPLTRRFFLQTLNGALGGLFGGIFLEGFLLIPLENLSSFLGIVVIGICVPFFMAIVEILLSNAYLKVLNGEQEGVAFFLDKDQFSIGYDYANDIVLTGYSEVCSQHSRIIKQGQQCILQNAQTGGQVLINYRLVNQQSMKRGDIVKIGTALLQFCEL